MGQVNSLVLLSVLKKIFKIGNLNFILSFKKTRHFNFKIILSISIILVQVFIMDAEAVLGAVGPSPMGTTIVSEQEMRRDLERRQRGQPKEWLPEQIVSAPNLGWDAQQTALRGVPLQRPTEQGFYLKKIQG